MVEKSLGKGLLVDAGKQDPFTARGGFPLLPFVFPDLDEWRASVIWVFSDGWRQAPQETNTGAIDYTAFFHFRSVSDSGY